MSTHTPGPWTATWCNVLAGEKLVADMVPGKDKDVRAAQTIEQCEANARLIAAAPRMLGALRRIANETCDHGAGFCPRDEARAILRDVEGESNG